MAALPTPVSNGGTGDTLDAKIPDAFPTTYANFTFVLDPDAAANTCDFTPADVACNSNADCTSYVKIGCGCFDPVYGVNTTNTVRCFASPCAPEVNADGGVYMFEQRSGAVYTRLPICPEHAERYGRVREASMPHVCSRPGLGMKAAATRWDGLNHGSCLISWCYDGPFLEFGRKTEEEGTSMRSHFMAAAWIVGIAHFFAATLLAGNASARTYGSWAS